MGTEFQFKSIDIVLEMDGGDDCTSWMYLTSMNYTFIYLFFNYILFLMLLQLSQFSPLPPSTQSPPTPSSNPYSIVHVHRSCIKVIWLLYTLCCTSPSHDYSVKTNLHFLIPSPFSSIPHNFHRSGNHQNFLCMYDFVSVLLVCLFCFLDSIVDRCVFIAILLFIFLIFYLKTF